MFVILLMKRDGIITDGTFCCLKVYINSVLNMCNRCKIN